MNKSKQEVHLNIHVFENKLAKRGLTLYHTIPSFNDPETRVFENIVGKGANASNQHFPTMFFLPYQSQKSPI